VKQRLDDIQLAIYLIHDLLKIARGDSYIEPEYEAEIMQIIEQLRKRYVTQK
jgi:hypothetical protein